MRFRRLLAFVSLLFAARLSAPAVAGADCGSPPFSLLWSYPEHGATDVPTNAEFWFLSSLWGVPPTVTFEGQPLAIESAGIASTHRASPGPLLPNHTYTLQVTPPEGHISAKRYEIQFTTGAGAATAPDAPEELGVAWSSAEPGTCSEVVASQDCFDTGQDTYMQLKVSRPAGALAWLVSGGYSTLWPVSCSDEPTLFVHSPWSAERCFKVRALGAGGLLSHETEACIRGPTQSDPDAGADWESTGGTASGGQAGGGGTEIDAGADEEARSDDGAGCSIAPGARDVAVGCVGWLVIGVFAWRSARRARGDG